MLAIWARALPGNPHARSRVAAVRAWLAAPSDSAASAALALHHGGKRTGYEGFDDAGGVPVELLDGVTEIDPATELAYWACDDAVLAAAAAHSSPRAAAEPARAALDAALAAHLAAGADERDATTTYGWRGDGVTVRLVRSVEHLDGFDYTFRLEVAHAAAAATVVVDSARWPLRLELTPAEVSDPRAVALVRAVTATLDELCRS